MGDQKTISLTNHDIYLSRYASTQLSLEDVNAEMAVVIPSYKEDGITKAIHSIFSCKPPCQVVVLVVINHPKSAEEEIKDLNRKTQDEISSIEVPDHFHLRSVVIALPDHKAGVGLARKIGLDQAVRWFEKSKINGIMVCFDADCECSPNYLQEIYRSFSSEETEAGIVFYEHPLNHEEIIDYEIFLRHYVDSLRYAGHPYVPQTLGSCMVINSQTYCKYGGMNTRQAGEDFYFLHKLLGKVHFSEINGATVFPSSRLSDRVPFGTGKALQRSKAGEPIKCYNPQSYEIIREFLTDVSGFREGVKSSGNKFLGNFLEQEKFDQEMERMQAGTSNYQTFRKQFFQWFDGFRVLKLLHFLRDQGLENVSIQEAVKSLDEKYWQLDLEKEDPRTQLLRIRTHNRSPFHYGL